MMFMSNVGKFDIECFLSDVDDFSKSNLTSYDVYDLLGNLTYQGWQIDVYDFLEISPINVGKFDMDCMDCFCFEANILVVACRT